jgi:hypothetical protein
MLQGKMTYTSIIVMFLVGIAGHYGVTIAEPEQEVLINFVTMATQVVTLVTGIYGRWRATKK